MSGSCTGSAGRSVSRPEEISYCIAYCPAGTTLDQLIRIAGSRWAVEECFQSAKQECGPDDHRVRRRPGWHRHMTWAMTAHACLTVLRAGELEDGDDETGDGGVMPGHMAADGVRHRVHGRVETRRHGTRQGCRVHPRCAVPDMAVGPRPRSASRPSRTAW